MVFRRWFSLWAMAWPALAWAQSAGPAPTPAAVEWQVRDTTRVEAWRFFEPPPGGGTPDYTFVATRLFARLDVRRPRYELTGAIQYVQFGHLPEHATGPGPLGAGPQYFDQSGSTASHHVYVRLLQLKLKAPGHGVTVQFGRFGYTSGAESASGDSKIETVKRQRIDSRMIGEFEFSLYQRTFDGARLDLDTARWHGTAAWMVPTQGGFEESAGASLRDVHLAAGTFSIKPGPSMRHTDVQGFVYRYDDTRPVKARPDNMFTAASVADVHITSFGGSVVGAYPARGGQVDALVWIVGQTGRWYGQPHGAGAAAVEAGFQWTSVPWRPWLRAGWFRSSGDPDARDGRHDTFFQMIPTVRRYSLSTVYNSMNSSEVFGQVLLRPRANVNVRVDVHRLRLTDAADLWYAGSGATQRAGAVFGFSGRRSNGSTDFGTMVEGTVDWAVSPHLSIGGYAGRMRGGDVVAGTFAGRHLLFTYLETTVSF